MFKSPVRKKVYRISVSSIFFLAGLCFASWASRIADIQTSLALSSAGLGAVLLALPCGLMLSLPLAGWMVHPWGSRIVVITASILYASTLPVLGLVRTTTGLMATLFVFGLGGNMLNISVNAQAVSTEILYGRPIMASYHGLWSLAGFAGAAAGTVLVGLNFKPLVHFIIIGCFALLIILVAGPFLVRLDNKADSSTPLFVKPDRAFINLGLIAFCSMICEGAMFDWSGVYFRKVIHPDKALVTAGYTAFMSTMAMGRFIGDKVTMHIGRRKTLQAGGALAATGLLLAVVFPCFVPALVGFFMVGAGVSSNIPLVYSAAGKSGNLNPGVAIAAVSTIGYLGFLFGPPLIGFIAQISSLKVSLGLIACLSSLIIYLAAKAKLED